MKTFKILFFFFLIVLFLPACLPEVQAETPSPVAPAPTGSPVFPPSAALQAREALAVRLGIAVERTTITMIASAQWPDSCLGLASANEMCAQGPVNGYRVVLRANGQLYEYHTDVSGQILRVAL